MPESQGDAININQIQCSSTKGFSEKQWNEKKVWIH